MSPFLAAKASFPRSVLPANALNRLSSSSLVDDEKQVGTRSARGCSGDRIYQPDPKLPDRAYEATKDHLSWASDDRLFTYENLPKFDNLREYGLDEGEEITMTRKEIDKYSQFAESSKPDLFDSKGVFGKTSPDGFKDLSSIIDQIGCNLQIIQHDNASMAMEHCPNTVFYDQHFRTSRKVLLERYGPEPRSITGRRPRLLSDPDRNIKVYHAIVDFIFGSTVWWLMRVAQSKALEAHILAVLARWAAKLKIIALDPTRSAERSLDRGENVIQRLSDSRKDDNDTILINIPDGYRGDIKKIDFTHDHINVAFHYYFSKLTLRDILGQIISFVTGNIIVQMNSPANFEVRTLIYKGPDESLRELMVNHNGSVRVLTEGLSVNQRYIALQLAMVNAERIHEALGAKSESTALETDAVLASWARADKKGLVSHVEMNRLDDLISVLVPLGLRTRSDQLTALAASLPYSDLSDEKEPWEKLAPSPGGDITTEFRLANQASLERERERTLPYASPDFIPNSEIPLWKSHKDTSTRNTKSDSDEPITGVAGVKESASKVASELDQHLSEIERWVVSEDCIMVYCRVYSSIILIIAASIVFGTISVPFLVQERMKGVDPFQWVTFAWLSAGAILVAAKSRYDESWPWHDFVRGQIMCRGVKQLAKVSGLNAQTILLCLIRNQLKAPLVFRGPYKSIFKIHSSDSGFSIDVPINYSTIVAAEFMVLRVVSQGAEYLYFKDIREDFGPATGQPKLVSEITHQQPKMRSSRMRHWDSQVLKLEIKKDFRYDQVLGQYARENRFG